ncbi:multidrug efflux pump subunit AcrB [Rhodopseudomonas julia]|uniref:Multidrug efflux pump subunit AcrB n=1 Tax=Rhodopseudomonas julia TaxID=200617 RepID=A0ABU0C139_9BRAD|nr:efflux RND transporter permease subunit [Rhodopseudomonas julia]MDQ0324239.1 multidrug efflux pump subunit AcrB [Rhodopseudomonas julia]
MNVSAWAVRNPVPVVLLFVLLLIGGLFSFSKLGVQSFPDLDLPLIQISADLEGAAPAQLETEVARKIEDSVASLSRLNHITTTVNDGSVSVMAEFEIAKDPEEALNEVRNAVDSVRADLPSEMGAPSVTKLSVQDSVLITYAVTSASLNEAELSWFVDNDMTKALRSVEGVGDVARVGGIDREIVVAVDPGKLAALGLSVTDVAGLLRSVQLDQSGGRVQTMSSRQSIRVLGAADTVDRLSSVSVPAANGTSVRLDQIATISDAHADRTSLAYLNGERVIGVQIKRSNGYSDVAVANGIRSVSADFAAAHRQVSIVEASNTVKATRDDYEASMHMLAEGIVIAIVIVWLFLRNWRATLVSAAALPLAMIPTFIVMDWFGFTLNVISLLALSLVVGILVDDAIVEVENIERHISYGGTPRAATIEATQEIGIAVIATTLTLVAVFLPTAFMGDIPGLVFRQFGVTAAAAVLASLLVARLLTPMMAASLLKSQGATNSHADGWLMRAYMRLACSCLAWRKLALLAVILFIAASLSLVPLLEIAFVPPADIAQTTVTLNVQPGSSLEETDAVVRQAAAAIAKVGQVRSVFAVVGASGSNSGGPNLAITADVTGALLTVDLTPLDERDRSQTQIENDIRAALDRVPGARVEVGAGGDGSTLGVVLASNDDATLLQAAKALEDQMRGLPGLGAVTSTAALEAPEVQIVPDSAHASAVGVTPEAIADVVRIATCGDYAFSQPKLNLPERQLPIRLKLDIDPDSNLEDIRQLRVDGNGGSVTLGSVADVKLGTGPTSISRIDRERNVTVSVELNGRSIGAVMEEVQALPAIKTLPASVRMVDEGEVERMDSMFAGFVVALVIGLVCIYCVLALLFHDFLQPFTILMAIPLSLGGALLPLVLTDTSFSMATAIGLLMLIGIVTKNSILIVEYAAAAQQKGWQRGEALLDACHKRARPVVMTTIAMIGGMCPVVLGLSGGDPSFRRPMGLVVIGGLFVSTALSLIVIPVIYSFVDDLSSRLRKRFTHAAILSHANGVAAADR